MTDNNNLNTTDKISYEQYKHMVIQDDIAKFSKNLKPFWWENIPVIGGMLYGVRTQLRASGLDRGLLQKQIQITNLIFVFSFLIYIDVILRMLTPWYSYWINCVVLKRAKKKIQENDI